MGLFEDGPGEPSFRLGSGSDHNVGLARDPKRSVDGLKAIYHRHQKQLERLLLDRTASTRRNSDRVRYRGVR
jgi:hypothetical protein